VFLDTRKVFLSPYILFWFLENIEDIFFFIQGKKGRALRRRPKKKKRSPQHLATSFFIIYF